MNMSQLYRYSIVTPYVQVLDNNCRRKDALFWLRCCALCITVVYNTHMNGYIVRLLCNNIHIRQILWQTNYWSYKTCIYCFKDSFSKKIKLSIIWKQLSVTPKYGHLQKELKMNNEINTGSLVLSLHTSNSEQLLF